MQGLLRTVLALALLCSAGLATSGCKTVRPWERERLAKRGMKLGERCIESGFKQHTEAARQGGLRCYGRQAGGCGCN